MKRRSFFVSTPIILLLLVTCGGGASLTQLYPDEGAVSSSGDSTSVTFPDQLRLWLKVDSLDGSLSNGASISSWSDSSGNARHATQSTAAYRPTYRSNVVNGYGAVEFDGTDDYFDNTLSYTAQTVFVVYRISSTLQVSTELAQLWGSYNDGVHVAPDARSGSTGGWSFDGLPASNNKGRHAINAGIFPSSYAVFALTPNWVYDRIQTVTAEFQAERTLNRQMIGSLASNFNVGEHQFGGQLFEIIVFGDTLTDAERAPIEGYLRVKYGLY